MKHNKDCPTLRTDLQDDCTCAENDTFDEIKLEMVDKESFDKLTVELAAVKKERAQLKAVLLDMEVHHEQSGLYAALNEALDRIIEITKVEVTEENVGDAYEYPDIDGVVDFKRIAAALNMILIERAIKRRSNEKIG